MLGLIYIAQAGSVRTATNFLEGWMVPVFLAILVIIAWIRITSPTAIPQVAKALFNVRLLRQMMREEGVISSMASRLLSLCFLLVTAMAIYLAVRTFGADSYNFSGIAFYGALVGSLLAMYAVKILSMGLFRFVVGGDFGLNELVYSMLAHNNIIGLCLFPIVLIAAVIPSQVYTQRGLIEPSIWPGLFLILAGIIVGIAYISRLVRGAVNSIQIRLPAIYIIFYLCTLEILPLVVLAKALKS